MTDNFMFVNNLSKVIDANRYVFLSRIAPNAKNFEKFITVDAFSMICQVNNKQSYPVKVKSISIDNTAYNHIIFVEFDDSFVVEDTDSYALAIAISTKDDAIKYYTLEKGGSYLNKGTRVAYVCQVNGSENINYGKISPVSMKSFAERVAFLEANK